MAIAPLDRQNWVLSSILPLALVASLVLGRRALPLSTASYALMIGFLAMHTIGAHYTYSRVPMGLWLQHAFMLQRNHFDRITHLAFGLLFTYPLFEAFRLLLKDTLRPLAYYVTLMTQLGLAAVWEMIEAAAAQGWLNRDRAIRESLTAIRRAGADMILTYATRDVADLLR